MVSGWLDGRTHLENRARAFPPQVLAQYAGQEVAFSADGEHIVAHGDNFLTLWNQLKAQGIDPSSCVWSSIPATDEPL